MNISKQMIFLLSLTHIGLTLPSAPACPSADLNKFLSDNQGAVSNAYVAQALKQSLHSLVPLPKDYIGYIPNPFDIMNPLYPSLNRIEEACYKNPDDKVSLPMPLLKTMIILAEYQEAQIKKEQQAKQEDSTAQLAAHNIELSKRNQKLRSALQQIHEFAAVHADLQIGTEARKR